MPKEETVYNELPGEIKGGKVYNPETGKEEDVDYIPTELDTIDWRKNPNTDAPPIKAEEQGDEENSGNTSTDNGNNNTDNTGNEQNNNGTNTNSAPTLLKPSYEVALMLPFVTNKFNSFENKSLFIFYDMFSCIVD